MIGRQPSRRAVLCLHCGSSNAITDWHIAAEEFSVKCCRCERRAMYRARDMKTLDGPPDLPNPQAAPRRGLAMFGAKRSA